MRAVSVEEAIRHAREAAAKEGFQVTGCRRILHTARDVLERELGRPREYGLYLVTFTIETTPEVNLVPAPHEPDEEVPVDSLLLPGIDDTLSVSVNDRTGEAHVVWRL